MSKRIKSISLEAEYEKLWDLLISKSGFVKLALREYSLDEDIARALFKNPQQAREIVESEILEQDSEYLNAKKDNVSADSKEKDKDKEKEKEKDFTSEKETNQVSRENKSTSKILLD